MPKEPMSIQPPTQTPTPVQTARLPGLANENQDFLPEAQISLLDILRFLKGVYKTILTAGGIGNEGSRVNDSPGPCIGGLEYRASIK